MSIVRAALCLLAACGGGCLQFEEPPAVNDGDGDSAGVGDLDVWVEPSQGDPMPDDPPSGDADPIEPGDGDGVDMTAWHLPDWERRVRMTIPATQDMELTQIPLLVHLSWDQLGGIEARRMRFVDLEGRVAPHELAKSSSSGADVWLLVPRLGKDVDEHLWLYYDDTRSEASSGESVWLDYGAVWHFDSVESPRDSTASNRDGAGLGDPGSDEWALGKALKLNGGVSVGVASVAQDPLDVAGQNLSIEAWVRRFNTDEDRVVLSRHNVDLDRSGYYLGITAAGSSESTHLVFCASEPDCVSTASGGPALVSNEWTHIAAVRDGASLAIYLNGQLAASGLTFSANLLPTASDLLIGALETAETVERYWLGNIDELRISTLPRSSAWVRAQVANVTGASWLSFTFGPEQLR